MKKTTKTTAAKKPLAAKAATAKPKPRVTVTLKVYPHVLQQFIGEYEETAERIMHPTASAIAERKGLLEDGNNIVVIETFDARGLPTK